LVLNRFVFFSQKNVFINYLLIYLQLFLFVFLILIKI